MAKENKLLVKAHEMGLLDERDVAVVADITCTNGNRGRAFFFLNKNLMYLYELRGFADFGAHVETLDLNHTKFIKGSSFLLNPNMKLEFGGHTYKFVGFAQPKWVIEQVKSSCKG